MARNIVENMTVVKIFIPRCKINIADIPEKQIEMRGPFFNVSQEGQGDLVRIQVQSFHHEN